MLRNVSVSSSFLSAIGDAIYDALSAEAVQRLTRRGVGRSIGTVERETQL